MANVDRPTGLRPVSTLSGAPYNGQMRKFYTDTDAFLGDIMIQDTVGIGSGDGGYQGVTRATSATATLAIGVVVGWDVNPDALGTTYHVGSATRAVYLCTDPNVIFECQDNGTAPALLDVGLNYDIDVTAGDTATGVSNMELEGGTAGAVTAATPLKLVGISDRADNEVGVANSKLLVTLNTHVYNTDVGSLGV